MTQFFIREIDHLNRNLLTLCGLVEENLNRAVKAIDTHDANLTKQVVEADKFIDESEVRIEEECQKILALHQPVANDLRFVVAVLKINNDLERIGDLATSIAQRVRLLGKDTPLPVPFDIHGMTARVQWMLRSAIDAFVREEVDLAKKVLLEDDKVDDIHREAFENVERRLRENHSQPNFESVIRWLSVSRCLERIADHTTNIAEDVIYMFSGEIVRHQHVEMGNPTSEKS